ncbi:hypothetical protein ACHWQZ_G000318 [Mnemiopsis leidyi]
MWAELHCKLEAVAATVPAASVYLDNRPVKLPWSSTALKRMRKNKDRAWAEFDIDPSDINLSNAMSKQHTFEEEEFKAKVSYEKKITSDLKHNSKAFYAYLRNKRQVKSSVVSLDRGDGTRTDTSAEAAEVLATAFSSVFVHEPPGPLPKSVNFKENECVIDDLEVRSSDVKKQLLKLNIFKSSGPDGVHPNLLKSLAYDDSFVEAVTQLFVKCSETGTLPKVWKSASVVALFKKGMNDLNDKKTKTDKKAGATRNKVVKSPEKTPSSFDYECLCPCKEYIVGEFSVGCEQCEKFWHYGCVGLKGLTEEMGRLLVNWLCPDCFKSPHSYKEVSKNDSVENKAVRAIIQEELQLFAPKLTRSLNDVINGNTEKTVKEAVHLYSEVTAKSQKKVIEDLSTAQASENVISKVQTKMHTDAFERNQRKLNLCVLKVPESKKDTSKQRQEDDAKFCLETLKIEKRDFISCHRAGKPDSEKPDYCRPLIIKTADEESVNYYSNHGKGWKESSYWINMDLCRADREIRFLARKERKKRQEGAAKKNLLKNP